MKVKSSVGLICHFQPQKTVCYASKGTALQFKVATCNISIELSKATDTHTHTPDPFTSNGVDAGIRLTYV